MRLFAVSFWFIVGSLELIQASRGWRTTPNIFNYANTFEDPNLVKVYRYENELIEMKSAETQISANRSDQESDFGSESVGKKNQAISNTRRAIEFDPEDVSGRLLVYLQRIVLNTDPQGLVSVDGVKDIFTVTSNLKGYLSEYSATLVLYRPYIPVGDLPVPQLQVDYHERARKSFGVLYEKLKHLENSQYVFIGMGHGGAIAAIHAIMFHQKLGMHRNSEKKIAIFTFGTFDVFTKAFGPKNPFCRDDHVDIQPQGRSANSSANFAPIGNQLVVDAVLENPSPIENLEIYMEIFINNRDEWTRAESNSTTLNIRRQAQSKIAHLVSELGYYVSHAYATFREKAPATQKWIYESCMSFLASKLKTAIEEEDRVTTQAVVLQFSGSNHWRTGNFEIKCKSERDSYKDKSFAIAYCYFGEGKEHLFARYRLYQGKPDILRDQNEYDGLDMCLAQIFNNAVSKHIFSPYRIKSLKLRIPLLGHEKPQLIYAVSEDSKILRALLSENPRVFYRIVIDSLFKLEPAFHQHFKPLSLTKEERGENYEYHLKKIHEFMIEYIKAAAGQESSESKSITLANFDIVNNRRNSEDLLLKHEEAWKAIVTDHYLPAYDCRDPLTQVLNNGHCPSLAKSRPDRSRVFSRIIPSSKKFFLGFRGACKYGSAFDPSYKDFCNFDVSVGGDPISTQIQIFVFCEKPKSIVDNLSQRTIYLTLFHEPNTF